MARARPAVRDGRAATARLSMDIGYEGLGSGFQGVGGGLYLLAVLVFAIGMFVT